MNTVNIPQTPTTKHLEIMTENTYQSNTGRAASLPPLIGKSQRTMQAKSPQSPCGEEIGAFVWQRPFNTLNSWRIWVCAHRRAGLWSSGSLPPTSRVFQFSSSRCFVAFVCLIILFRKSGRESFANKNPLFNNSKKHSLRSLVQVQGYLHGKWTWTWPLPSQGNLDLEEESDACN